MTIVRTNHCCALLLYGIRVCEAVNSRGRVPDLTNNYFLIFARIGAK